MNVLLLDTNVSSYPIFECLLEKGYNVFVAGSNPNDCLALTSENYLNFDYSDFGVLIEQVKKNYINYVIPGCNDLSYKMAAKYNQFIDGELNIENELTNDKINVKHLFKEFAYEIGLKIPKKINFNDLMEYSFCPIIVKPSDSFSGKGVTVIDYFDRKKIDVAIELAKNNSKSNTFVVEEFIEGQLFSHSAFIYKGMIKLDFIVEEHCNFYPFAVDKSWVLDSPNCLFYEDIRAEVQKLINALQLKPGLIHTQFIYSKGELKILEITRRCPGDLYAKLIEYSTGINYALLYTDLILNAEVNFEQPRSKNEIIRETIHKKDKTYFTLNLESFSSIKEFVPIVKTGFLPTVNSSRLGILFYNKC
jgi:hypothetical protein